MTDRTLRLAAAVLVPVTIGIAAYLVAVIAALAALRTRERPSSARP